MNGQRRLILIKHAKPRVDPDKPPEGWPLSEEGRAAAERLADAVAHFDFAKVITSDELKARETAEIIGQKLGKPVSVGKDLHEHDRSGVPQMQSREFISMIALFFQRPDELVLGNETADEACDRFTAAIDRILESEAGDIAIVTHGTVMSLLTERRAGEDPFAFWRKMQNPSYVSFDLPSWTIGTMYERI